MTPDRSLNPADPPTAKPQPAHESDRLKLLLDIIRDVAKVMRWVKASAVDENGDQFYPTKWSYEFADIPVVENQHTPMFTGEEITKIIAKAEKQERVIYVLFAASGLREQANCSVSK